MHDLFCKCLVSKKYHCSRYIELLTMFWDCGWILFPQTVFAWTTNQKWLLITNALYSPQKHAMVRKSNAFDKKKNYDVANTYLVAFFALTDIASISDLSPGIVEAFKPFAIADAERRRTCRSAARDATARVEATTNALLVLYNSANPEATVPITRRPRLEPPPETRRVDGKFRWLATKNPKLVSWADAFRDYVGQLTTARIRSQVDCINSFGDFLCSLENPPLPFELKRNVHVLDVKRIETKTYSEHLKKQDINTKRKNDAFSRLRLFYDWYLDSVPIDEPARHGFVNPFFSTDKLGKSDAPGQTSRDALPAYILNEMKAVITDNDFEFARKSLQSDATVFDSQAGEMRNVWFPGLAVCLYLMLEAPIRAMQARWLDSGLLDDFIYQPSKKREIPNNSGFSIPGRREGVLRLQGDVTLADKWLSLWINTNKTAVYDNPNVGYSIPYVSDEAASLVNLMIDWQRRYMPALQAPVSYLTFGTDTQARGRLKGTGPQVAPLFRDPTSKSGLEPVTYARLGRFYTSVLSETQDRIRVKYGKDVVLVTTTAEGKMRWAVDLHTLRVSGITSMIESGVPLEVVSQFVAGHATLVMTLHYLKYSPQKLRQFLFEAHERMKDDTEFLESELFNSNLDVFSPFILSQSGRGSGAGYEALKERSGLLSINAEGICPGTSCSSGGPATGNTFGPVPGGQRCGLCRYWLTGPAHLLGQVASVNSLAYTIRKKGQKVAELHDERIEAEDSGSTKDARRLRDRIELLNRELAIDLEEWTARYNYASRSVELLDSYLASKAAVEGASVPLALLTKGTAVELKVTLEQAHEFALLDQITQMSEFVTGFVNSEAGLEKNLVLSKMMSANGITPFLLGLSDKQAHEAGNLLSALVLQQVRTQELDEVLNGRSALANYPALERTVKALGEHAEQIKLGGTPMLGKVAESAQRKKGRVSPKSSEEVYG